MRASLRDGLTTAIKSRDRVAVAALRSALAAIDNAESVPLEHPLDKAARSEHVAAAAVGVGATEAARRQLTDADLHDIVAKEVRERAAAAREYEQYGRSADAETLRAEAAVLSRYLTP